MNIKLIKATEQDATKIANLARKIWLAHYIDIISIEQIEYMLHLMYSAESLKEQMLQKKQEFYLITDNDVLRGYISFTKENNDNYFIHKFYIDTTEQNKGIGTQSFDLLLAQLINCKEVRLAVNRHNYKSINFYFKLGFRIEKLLNTDIGNNYFMDDFVMGKIVRSNM